MTRTLIAGLLALLGLTNLWAQPTSDAYQRIDGIVAVVGDEIVLASDVRDRVTQAQLEGREVSADNECGLIESILFEKLLLHNARLDSLEVTDAEVMGEIDRRLTYYLQMFGSLEAFEAEYGKSVAEWKAEFQDPVREQILAQKMQANIDQSVRSTPAEVQDYFGAIPADSLPLIPEELSYSELVMQPEVGEAQKMRTRNTLDSIRTLVSTGKISMTLAATRYSEDPGSKYKGGCYKNIVRGQFVPEFEGAVFETAIGDYSPVFESDFGIPLLAGDGPTGRAIQRLPRVDEAHVRPTRVGTHGGHHRFGVRPIGAGRNVVRRGGPSAQHTRSHPQPKRPGGQPTGRRRTLRGGRTGPQRVLPAPRPPARRGVRACAIGRRRQPRVLGDDPLGRAVPGPPRQPHRRLRPVSATSRSRDARRSPVQVD